MIVRKNRCFLAAFNPALPRKFVSAYLDDRSEVQNWYSLLPGQIFIASDHSAQELGELLRRQFPRELLLITQINESDCNGWLPEEAWDFIREAQSPPSSVENRSRELSDTRS
jgi:hypothetical protein